MCLEEGCLSLLHEDVYTALSWQLTENVEVERSTVGWWGLGLYIQAPELLKDPLNERGAGADWTKKQLIH